MCHMDKCLLITSSMHGVCITHDDLVSNRKLIEGNKMGGGEDRPGIKYSLLPSFII